MNNISFQGRTNIKFNNQIFDTIKNTRKSNSYTNLNSSDINYKIINGRFITFDPNEVDKTSVLLINEKGGRFFHNAQERMLEITENIEKLKTSAKDKLTAWIIGGRSGEQTTKEVNALAEILCDRVDIDTSIIAGQKAVVPNFTLHKTLDKFEMNISLPINNVDKPIDKSLESYFDIVELNNTISS